MVKNVRNIITNVKHLEKIPLVFGSYLIFTPLYLFEKNSDLMPTP
jgi:hypothetical protein